MASQVCRKVLVALFFIAMTSSGNSWIRSRVHHGWTLNTTDGVSVAAQDLTNCLRGCIHTNYSLCLAVSFNESAGECRHFTTRLVVLNGTINEQMVLTQWATDMYIDVETTFALGEELCASLGGRLMTTLDMQDAYDRRAGLVDNRCGWVDEGSQMIVRWPSNSLSALSPGAHGCPNNIYIGSTWCTLAAP